ncbi:MAG: MATE family efflux transporter, partial [Muribaculaceae bacterium]|nr:MATE family efflux transporter [Muribaculaceae bacterium]
NIAASLTLVFAFSMRIEGVAIGSAIAQWCGFIYGLLYAVFHYHPRLPRLKRLMDLTEIKRFFSVNTDIFLRTVCLVAVTLWFTRAGASQGVDILAANALLLQLFMFFSYFMDGFAFAGEALAGKFHGAGERQSLTDLIKRLSKIGVALAISFSLVYMLFGDDILSILTDDSAVLNVCSQYRWWAIAIPVAGTMAFVWDGILIGLTRTRIMLLSMIISSALFFGLYFVTRPFLANHGLWLSFIIYLASRGMFELILYKHSVKKY